ncbi:ATP-dependent RNA helicase DHX36 [Strigomonas culicis]|uniref:RNA helicase n=1 Tax=Strigomonas culicis TaxID=28005 RepID=S9VIQ8_9TRYP|nr:ATP-dependent RNA helicase DHX36 [Strigomonas culicis]|eukprot:EPY27001.1 ATP-dependent RNA helicase DHX36 [Strigomonas culicis]
MHPGSSFKGYHRPNRGNDDDASGQNRNNNTNNNTRNNNNNNNNGGGGGGYRGGRGGRDNDGGYRGYRGGYGRGGGRDSDGYDNQRGRGGSFGGRGRGLGNYTDPAASAVNINLPGDGALPREDDLSTWRKKDFTDLVRAFVENKESMELTFPSTLNPAQRNMVHRIAMTYNLDHKSHGVGEDRQLKLTKVSGVVASQRQEEAAANGERVKTIDGYQGAQALPFDYLREDDAKKVLSLLTPLQLAMYRELQMEANKPTTTKRFHAAHPGLKSVPSAKRDGERYRALQKFRETLPTYKRRTDIINHVRDNDVVVICGDTGCGKTTQIPQLLLDSHILEKGTSIVCTQPRRISALSVANRVAAERGETCGDSCGYIIRFENVTSSNTQIVYATTGILLRRLHSEPELRGVACVVVDEVHERDVETDFCLLLLRDRLRAQREHPERFPLKLKLVVMSATVQIESLVRYFAGYNGQGRAVPLVQIPGTLFPVEEYFLEDALQWIGASKETIKAAASYQSGAAGSGGGPAREDASGTLYDKLKSSVFQDSDRDVEAMVPYDVVYNLIVHLHGAAPDMTGSVLVFLPGWAAISRVSDMLRRSPVARELSILPLHSSLTSSEQQRVFEPPPKRYRKVVLATSIAETSITIDDIVYVVDCGLVKGTSYDPAGNTSALRAMLISKANGIQRRGRAGRCRAGVCVHLLPRGLYESQPDFLPPEIVRSPLEEVCLQIKAIQPDERCAAVLARAMDPPPAESVTHATEFLVEVGALTEKDEHLTNLGRALAQLPVHPLLGKMLFSAACFGVLDPVATIAAGLSVKSVFIKPQTFQRDAARASMARLDNGDMSDHLCVLKVYEGWLRSGRDFQYAAEHFADPTTLRSLERTKLQLKRLVLNSTLVRRMERPDVTTSRHATNRGLVQLVMLWALYPRIATTEYRANRHSNQPNIFCWDNKSADVSPSSVLFKCKRDDYGTKTFIMYYERMQIESQLNLFDSSAVSPVDVSLCLRQLTIRPLLEMPDFLLRDEESKLAPAKRLNLDELEDKAQYAAMLFDGDKKVYLAPRHIASALQMARECMDYYLALCIKQLRADAFPAALLQALAITVGYPLQAASTWVPAAGGAGELLDEADVSPDNAPAFLRGHRSEGSSSSDDDGGPTIVQGGGDMVPELRLSEVQRAKVIEALGDLAVFRRDGAVGLLDAAERFKKEGATPPPAPALGPAAAAAAAEPQAVQPQSSGQPAKDDDDDDEDDEDIIVAPIGGLEMRRA